MDKAKIKLYKDKCGSFRRRKIFLILLLILLISFIAGILYLALLDKSGKDIVVDTITNHFKNYKNMDIKNELLICFKNNVLLTFIMWLFGISLFGVILEVIFIILKSFTLGFSISSIIYTYKLKGILVSLIYLLPDIFNLIIYFILGFFAVNFSIYLYKYLFRGKDINLRYLLKKYSKILLICLILLIISSLIQVFVVPYILKLFTKSIF